MTLLDDYEVPYKIRGVIAVHQMLQNVPIQFLKRTGVDALFLSVTIIYAHVSNLILSFSVIKYRSWSHPKR